MTKKESGKRRGRVFAVANLKGGVGKSLTSDHLAVHLNAVAIDLDPNQGDTERFALTRGLDYKKVSDYRELFDVLEALTSEGRDVVLDCPPGEAPETRMAIVCADAVIAPTRPGPNDLAALGRITSLVREVRSQRPKLPLFFLCNFYRRSEVADLMVGVLQASSEGKYIGKLWERKEYAAATQDGKAVWEHAPDKPGAEEMRNLCRFLDVKVTPYDE